MSEDATCPGVRPVPWDGVLAILVDGARGFWGRTRSYMAPGRARKLERDLPANLSTLFHHVEGMADVNTWFVRGCGSGARFTRASKPAAFLRSLITTDWYSSDLQAEHAVIAAFERGFPSVFAVFPAVDELGHRFGPLSAECIDAYRRFDRCLGRIIDALVRLGRADRTLIVIGSDHGQTTTHTHFELSAFTAQSLPRTVSYPFFWRYPRSADAAVMVSGNAMANVYVRGARGWYEPADPENGASPAGELLERLLAHEAIDHVLYRSRRGESSVIAGRRGRAVVSPLEGDALSWHVTGEDPLGYSPALPPVMTRDQVLTCTARSAYPDAPWQVAQFFQSRRAGDLAVCARHGFDLRARFEYQPHKGSHGGLGADHMLTPALVNARWIRPLLRSVDLFPSILSALGLPFPAGLDGETVEIL
jgi:hypothetical protein